MSPSVRRVLQMRVVVEASDYDEAVAFYRDVLGGAEELVVDGAQGERVTILDVGRATLELSNPAQVDMIDRIEVGRRVSPRMRLAFEVADAGAVTEELLASVPTWSPAPPAHLGNPSTHVSTARLASTSQSSRN